MKGLILSGGAGSRLRPFTYSTAKQLLPVGNVPILHRAISAMADVGITDVGIVVGHTARHVMDSVRDGSALGVKSTFIQQAEPLGLGHCVKISQEFLGADDFVMFLGDNVFEFGLRTFIDEFEASSQSQRISAQVAVKPVDNPSAFGVAVIDSGNRLLDVEEKPTRPKSNLALVGTYLFTSDIHDAIDAIRPSKRGELEITDAIQHLVSTHQIVGVHEVKGWWYDTGTPADFLACNAAVLLQTGGSAPTLSNNVRLIPPCAIHESAKLADCTVGPYVSIGSNAKVSGVVVSNSVLMSDSSVSGTGVLTDSIVGQRSDVAISGSNVSTLLVGDDSQVQTVTS